MKKLSSYAAIALIVSLAVVGAVLSLSSAAFAAQLRNLPSYSYKESSIVNKENPLNIFFGDTGYPGRYFGTLQGVIDGVTGSTYFYEVINYFPGWCPYQYVKFFPTSGSSIVRSNARSLGTGLTSTRYHMRLFLDPFSWTDGSTAEHNTVTPAHHERWTGSDHEIDQSYEAAENYIINLIHNGYPANDVWYDRWSNGGLTPPDGWWSDGMMSAVYLAP